MISVCTTFAESFSNRALYSYFSLHLQELENNVFIISPIKHVFGFARLPSAVHLLRLQQQFNFRLQCQLLQKSCMKGWLLTKEIETLASLRRFPGIMSAMALASTRVDIFLLCFSKFLNNAYKN